MLCWIPVCTLQKLVLQSGLKFPNIHLHGKTWPGVIFIDIPSNIAKDKISKEIQGFSSFCTSGIRASTKLCPRFARAEHPNVQVKRSGLEAFLSLDGGVQPCFTPSQKDKWVSKKHPSLSTLHGRNRSKPPYSWYSWQKSTVTVWPTWIDSSMFAEFRVASSHHLCWPQVVFRALQVPCHPLWIPKFAHSIGRGNVVLSDSWGKRPNSEKRLVKWWFQFSSQY